MDGFEMRRDGISKRLARNEGIRKRRASLSKTTRGQNDFDTTCMMAFPSIDRLPEKISTLCINSLEVTVYFSKFPWIEIWFKYSVSELLICDRLTVTISLKLFCLLFCYPQTK